MIPFLLHTVGVQSTPELVDAIIINFHPEADECSTVLLKIETRDNTLAMPT